MLYLVTGPPGSGKTFYCVRKIVQGLDSGRHVATNIALHPGWEREAAASNGFRRLIPGQVERRANRNAQLLYSSADLDELSRLRLPPCGRCTACQHGRTCQKEGRGMMILDEAHGWLNARTWDADETGQGRTRAEATKRRLDIVQFFALHRKFGWTVYLITQDEKRLDVQVRSNFQEHIHLKNLKGWKVPILGIPLFPVNMFVAVTTWHDNEASRLGVETYFLNRRVANLYDTMAISGDHAYDRPDAIYLGGIRPQLLPPGAPSELIQ